MSRRCSLLLAAGSNRDRRSRPTVRRPQLATHAVNPETRVSPVLSNIYLDRMDKFAETVLIPEYTRGKARAKNPGYRRAESAVRRARRRGDRAAERELRQQLRSMPSMDPRDSGYRRLRYTRYADDALLGFTGPKAEAEEIKTRLAAFLRDDLKLELSEEK